MRLYPAIDIKNGQCVRLKQGRFNDVEVYSLIPAEIAKDWEACGASYIHVVDLDGALAGRMVNEEAIRNIIKSVKVPVQTGGGIRTPQDVEMKLNMGISRVIIGTKAVENPAFVKEMVQNFGAEHIVVGIDARNGYVAVEGWEKTSSRSAVEFALQMKDIGVQTIVYTDIAKDGMLQGPNLDATAEMVRATGLDIIASGGVSAMKDLEDLEAINAGGAIIGKALYEKRVNLREAVERFENR